MVHIRASRGQHRPALLTIMPPSPVWLPLGAASLLGELAAAGCHDFEFMDLRLFTSFGDGVTWRRVGLFGETYVMDVAELPLVLRLIGCFERGEPFTVPVEPPFEDFFLSRGVVPAYGSHYFRLLDQYCSDVAKALSSYEFIGLTTYGGNYLPTLMLVAHLKKLPRPPFIVLGGPQVSESRNSAKLALQSRLVDTVVIGEGERTLVDLYAEYRRSGGRPHQVAGCMTFDPQTGTFPYRNRSRMKITEKSDPDFSSFPVRLYQRFHPFPGPMVPIEMSRGCTDKCEFCSEWSFWERFRLDTVERVVDQMKRFRTDFGAEFFMFSDSLLNGVRGRIVQFCETLIREDLGLKWGGYMRATVDEDLADLLARSGCKLIFFGIESLSDETLTLMNKRNDEVSSIGALENTLRAGIPIVHAGLIPGFPGDRRERFLSTAKRLRQLKQRYPALGVNLTPFSIAPGQRILDRLDEVGLVPHSWGSETLDLAPDYRPITESILERVSGDNQGLERLGQFMYAQTIESSTIHDDSPLAIDCAERLSEDVVRWSTISVDWRVAYFLSDRGVREGLLVTTWESAELEGQLEDLRSLPYRQRRQVFQALVSEYRRRLVAAERWMTVPSIAPFTCAGSLDRAGSVALGPFVLARVVPAECSTDIGCLMIVDYISCAHCVLPAASRILLERIQAGPATVLELRDRCKDFGLNEVEVQSILVTMWSAGCLVSSVRSYEGLPWSAPTRSVSALRVLPSERVADPQPAECNGTRRADTAD